VTGLSVADSAHRFRSGESTPVICPEHAGTVITAVFPLTGQINQEPFEPGTRPDPEESRAALRAQGVTFRLTNRGGRALDQAAEGVGDKPR